MEATLEQLNLLISKYEEEDREDKNPKALTARAVEMIRRIAGTNSEYFKKAQDSYYNTAERFAYGNIGAIVIALRDDVEAGLLSTIQETIHAEVFSDYLEMAEHLLDKKFKDPAAVIIGSTLENHVKKLCGKHGVATEGDNGKPVKLDTLNSQLAKAEIYNKLDQKNITAWSGLRNDAAHGDYDKYTVEQVKILLDSVRNFITRLPA